MIDNVLFKIKNDNLNIELNENDIRNYIWVYDSNVNTRININNSNEKFDFVNDDTWINIIKPKCDIYRYGIMKLLNLKKLL
jgi:hypothetical protein